MDRNWTQGLSHGAVLKRTNGTTKVLEQGSEEAKQLSSSIVQRSIVEMYFFESDIDKIDGEAEINFRIRRKKKSRWREQLKPTSLSLLVVVLPPSSWESLEIVFICHRPGVQSKQKAGRGGIAGNLETRSKPFLIGEWVGNGNRHKVVRTLILSQPSLFLRVANVRHSRFSKGWKG